MCAEMWVVTPTRGDATAVETTTARDSPVVAPTPGGSPARLTSAPARRTRGDAMVTATILALPDVVPLDVAAAWQILGAELPRSGAPYRVRVCGERPGLG